MLFTSWYRRCGLAKPDGQDHLMGPRAGPPSLSASLGCSADREHHSFGKRLIH